MNKKHHNKPTAANLEYKTPFETASLKNLPRKNSMGKPLEKEKRVQLSPGTPVYEQNQRHSHFQKSRNQTPNTSSTSNPHERTPLMRRLNEGTRQLPKMHEKLHLLRLLKFARKKLEPNSRLDHFDNLVFRSLMVLKKLVISFLPYEVIRSNKNELNNETSSRSTPRYRFEDVHNESKEDGILGTPVNTCN
ncbi:hypothetical protein Tco_0598678 [Tanacetum coccineum]